MSDCRGRSCLERTYLVSIAQCLVQCPATLYQGVRHGRVRQHLGIVDIPMVAGDNMLLGSRYRLGLPFSLPS